MGLDHNLVHRLSSTSSGETNHHDKKIIARRVLSLDTGKVATLNVVKLVSPFSKHVSMIYEKIRFWILMIFVVNC